MIVERALPFDQQLSFSLSLFTEFFMIVDDSFSRLTTRMIAHDSFSVSCSRDFAYATAGELSSTITNFFGRLTT